MSNIGLKLYLILYIGQIELSIVNYDLHIEDSLPKTIYNVWQLLGSFILLKIEEMEFTLLFLVTFLF